MATLIICPVCETRYEIKAAFPPEGRKVRCTKCSHVWQAMPASAGAQAPAPQAAPAPQVPPQAQVLQAQVPQAQVPQAQVPQAPAPQAPPRQAARPQAPEPPPAGQVPPPQAAPPPAHRVDAEYGLHDDGVAEAAEMNADAAPPPPAPVPPGGLFTKIMGARAPEAAPPPPPPQADAAFGEAGPMDVSFDAGYPEDEAGNAALADPDLVAAAFGEASHKAKAARKKPPIVAIGWGMLALIVAIVAGLFALAPSTTVSILPGAAKVYSLLGMPVGARQDGHRGAWG